MYKTLCNVPQRLEACTINSLERMGVENTTDKTH